MRKAISGYLFLTREYGLIKAIKYFISWYYGQFKQRGIDFSKEHLIETNGRKLLVMPNDPGISKELLKFHMHEPVTTEFLSKKLKEGMTCLDLGANIGYYATLESKKVGKNGHVIAIEPSPVNFEYLKRNLELQKQGNAEAYNLACGSDDGEIDFLVSEFSNMCRILWEGVKPPAGKNTIVKIPIRKLDTFLKEKSIEKLDLIRMDIEGGEIKVFQGAKETIKKFKPMIQIEFHPGRIAPNDSKSFLRHLLEEGYELTYYLIGYLDTPLVGTMNDVKKHTIENLIEMIDKKKIPNNLLLFFENKS